MTEETPTRRRLLRLSGGGLALLLAGCAAPGEGGEEDGEGGGVGEDGGEEGGEGGGVGEEGGEEGGGEEALAGRPTGPAGPAPR